MVWGLKGLKVMAAPWEKWFIEVWGDVGTAGHIPMIKMGKGKEVDLGKCKLPQAMPSPPAVKHQQVTRASTLITSPQVWLPPLYISADELSPQPVSPTTSRSWASKSVARQPASNPMLEESITN